jgi:phosphoribosyl 1,2-cyclic phosphate phosphodiesterase
MKVTILGCGGSGGVPLLGNHWGACDPNNPRNRRRRVSVLVQQGDINIIIDTSPDFRAQMLDAGIKHLNAILYTHDHADHTQGIDDVRFLKSKQHNKDGMVPAHASENTLRSLTRRFDYVFAQSRSGSGQLYKPFLKAMPLAGPFTVAGLPVTPYDQDHGFGEVTTGFRIGNMAYSTDCVGLPEASLDVLQGLDLFIVDCLRFEPHQTHAHFDMALDWAKRLKPKHTILTHMNHMVDFATIKARCPEGVEPGYDGLAVMIDDSAP